jgi:2-C-methyl-D-erythritol 4-phosphate cytidylyltransferase
MSKRSIIITAGGSGKRMGNQVPKQFLALRGKPIIMLTLQKFQFFDPSIEMIIVLPESHIPTWEGLCQKHLFTRPHKVVAGGAERFHSVKNGLAEATGDIIGIHDAVRPFVSLDVIRNCFETAERCGSAVPVVPVTETLRRMEGEHSMHVDRSDYRVVQTPQCFETAIIRRAYEQEYTDLFTDDASVVEASGSRIYLVEGNRENMKITTPDDLAVAGIMPY